ncbi:MAG: menaquinol-cytochrome c reductase iron-sulfur subunit [Gaiellaceae bacterium]|nr:menaquinol-cytochrome c reductase iron-sulfur subunit [Gaiellaceae bacterium]
MGAPSHEGGAGIAPLCFALGMAVLLVGLIVNPLLIAPLGGAISLAGGIAWTRRNREPAEEPPAQPAANEHAVDVERFPRSRLLERATLALGGLVALGVALPAASFAILPSFLGQRRRPVDLGPIAAFSEGEFVVATFLADSQAGEVSRRAVYIRRNGRVGELPSFTIMSSRCTHIGCPTQPNGPLFSAQWKAERTSAGEVGLVPTQPSGFGCPCHGSQFDNEGNRTAGPAPRGLDRYEFSIRNGHLWLGRLYSVSHVDGTGSQARIHSFALKGDGEPATGPEAWLYPIDAPS